MTFEEYKKNIIELYNSSNILVTNNATSITTNAKFQIKEILNKINIDKNILCIFGLEIYKFPIINYKFEKNKILFYSDNINYLLSNKINNYDILDDILLIESTEIYNNCEFVWLTLCYIKNISDIKSLNNKLKMEIIL